ncbi:hypothetical protein AB4Y64_17655 [Lysobacter sp. TAF61]|uniref:hypothetical protein n=1 Tax=Lysobacter sp. TAF61 TaxID=3233072 RepID=UPI003F979E9E
MDRTLNLSWARFGLGLTIASVFPALLIASKIDDRDSWPDIVAICFLLLSVFVFVARGWARLRKANAAEPLSAWETDRIRQLLIGPVGSRLVWFSFTVITLLLWAVARGVAGRAA